MYVLKGGVFEITFLTAYWPALQADSLNQIFCLSISCKKLVKKTVWYCHDENQRRLRLLYGLASSVLCGLHKLSAL